MAVLGFGCPGRTTRIILSTVPGAAPRSLGMVLYSNFLAQRNNPPQVGWTPAPDNLSVEEECHSIYGSLFRMPKMGLSPEVPGLMI